MQSSGSKKLSPKKLNQLIEGNIGLLKTIANDFPPEHFDDAFSIGMDLLWKLSGRTDLENFSGYVSVAVHRAIINHLRARKAKKRGGDFEFVSLDNSALGGEGSEFYDLVADHELSPLEIILQKENDQLEQMRFMEKFQCLARSSQNDILSKFGTSLLSCIFCHRQPIKKDRIIYEKGVPVQRYKCCSCRKTFRLKYARSQWEAKRFPGQNVSA